jgi:pyruvate,water dikinase
VAPDMFGSGKKAERKAELRRLFRWKYENLRNLLRQNCELLEILSDIQSHVGGRIPGNVYTHRQISDLLDGTLMMIGILDSISKAPSMGLYEAHKRIASGVQQALWKIRERKKPPILMPLETVDRSQLNYAGGKAGHLGELKKILPENVPGGFALTTAAYQIFLNDNNLTGQIRAFYSRISPDDPDGADFFCSQIRRFVKNGIVPDQITEAIEKHVQSDSRWHGSSWAVRSSAVGEDGLFSFAGQFDTLLNVPENKLSHAYLEVVASRFNSNAVLYRLSNDVKDAESSMAVLFVPMIEAESSGVILTVNPAAPDDDNIIISSVRGLAADLVAGEAESDTFYMDRRELKLREQVCGIKETMIVASANEGLERRDVPPDLRDSPSISQQKATELARLACKIEGHYGRPQDIEWAIDKQGKCWILQSRQLRLNDALPMESEEPVESRLLAEGGVTVFPGRTQGRLQYLESSDKLGDVEKGVILLSKQAGPEIVSVFPRISGLITEKGHPTSHAANVAREYGLPTLFNVENAVEKLKDSNEIGLDSARKKIYAGSPWPNLPHRDVSKRWTKQEKPGILRELLFHLNLTDPADSNFTPAGCRSMHDLIRYMHQKAVTSLFDLGDEQVKNLKESFKLLDSSIPLFLTVLDLGGSIMKEYGHRRSVPPEGIISVPFRALWAGVTNPEIRWAGRSTVSLSGMATVVMTSMTRDVEAVRRMGDRNYIIVGPEYLNFNARLAYHYTMIDAVVCDRPENNYIIFRFRGGGAGRARRGLRARFLTGVLRFVGFSVDQREDLVTAWYKGYEKEICREKLEILGRLMGCARQLDMLTENIPKVNFFIESFTKGDYKPFR